MKLTIRKDKRQGMVNLSIWSLLGILFIALKLTNVILWSWWWVLAPFWIPGIITVLLILLLAIVE